MFITETQAKGKLNTPHHRTQRAASQNTKRCRVCTFMNVQLNIHEHSIERSCTFKLLATLSWVMQHEGMSKTARRKGWSNARRKPERRGKMIRKKRRTTCLTLFRIVVSPGIEPGTQGFSVLCSTNWAMTPFFKCECKGKPKIRTMQAFQQKKWRKSAFFLRFAAFFHLSTFCRIFAAVFKPFGK